MLFSTPSRPLGPISCLCAPKLSRGALEHGLLSALARKNIGMRKQRGGVGGVETPSMRFFPNTSNANRNEETVGNSARSQLPKKTSATPRFFFLYFFFPHSRFLSLPPPPKKKKIKNPTPPTNRQGSNPLKMGVPKRVPSLNSQVEARCRELGGDRAIHSVLVANNGLAAVKFIRSVRSWAYKTFGNERAVAIVAMATPEDMRIDAEHIRMADQFVEVRS